MASKTLGQQLLGYPALFFLETLHENRGDKTHMERMWSLHGEYCFLLAYLPTRYEGSQKLQDEYIEKLLPKLTELKEEIDAMFHEYQGIYEGETCSTEEKNFLITMRGVRERIHVLGAMGKMIDKAVADEEEFIV